MTTSDELIADFAQVCRDNGGELKEGMLSRHCLFKDVAGNSVDVLLDIPSSNAQVSIGRSDVTLFDVVEIDKGHKSFSMINKKRDIINVRPYVGIATFDGNTVGHLMTE